MKANSQLFEAYLKCPTKCWLKSRDETGIGNAYAEWVEMQNEAYRGQGVRRLDVVPESERVVEPLAETFKAAKWRLAVDFVSRASSPTVPGNIPLAEQTPGGTPPDGIGTDETVAHQQLPEPWFWGSRLHAIERVAVEGRGHQARFIPIRFIFRNKLVRDDRLLVVFDALVLSESLGRDVSLGKIVHGDDHATLEVKTASLLREVRKRALKMAEMVSSSSSPELVLNRHKAVSSARIYGQS